MARNVRNPAAEAIAARSLQAANRAYKEIVDDLIPALWHAHDAQDERDIADLRSAIDDRVRTARDFERIARAAMRTLRR